MSDWYDVLHDLHGGIVASTGLTPVQVRALHPEAWRDARPPALVARRTGDGVDIERDTLGPITAPVDPTTIRYAPAVKPLQPAGELPGGISMLTDPTIGEGRFLLRSLEQIVIGAVAPPRPANRDHHTAGRVAHHDVASLLAERARAAAAGHEHGAVVRLHGPWGEVWMDGDAFPVDFAVTVTGDPDGHPAHGWRSTWFEHTMGKLMAAQMNARTPRSCITITGV